MPRNCFVAWRGIEKSSDKQWFLGRFINLGPCTYCLHQLNDTASLHNWQSTSPQSTPKNNSHSSLKMKTVSEILRIPETIFDFIRSDSPVTVILGNEIGYHNFVSEQISKSVWRFTNCFLRLPKLVKIYRIQVSELSRINNKP